MIETGHWTLSSSLSSENIDVVPFGFIYRITCVPTNKQYIGKKQCLTVKKRPPLKNKKNKRHSIGETDWKTYTSSSKEVNSDLLIYGVDNFKFEIILLCNSKFALAYNEARIQFEEEVLLRDEYYNGIINLRIPRLKNKML